MIDKASQPKDFSMNYLSYLKTLIDDLCVEKISSFIELILKTRDKNKTIFFIGNGGSASTASHFVNDISLGSRQFEKPFRALSLCDNQAVITAIGNDDGYENIFVQQLQTQARTDDVLVSISASGNSPNIIKAVNWAKKNQLSTVGLSAFDGGELSKLVDLNIHVPTKIGEYGPAEDLHMVICGLVGSFFRAYFKDD
tara:strand:+ start:1061 stop:1651 length:591 start_codon:yes stop_codon:yes gene_type:complete